MSSSYFHIHKPESIFNDCWPSKYRAGVLRPEAEGFRSTARIDLARSGLYKVRFQTIESRGYILVRTRTRRAELPAYVPVIGWMWTSSPARRALLKGTRFTSLAMTLP